jgi:transcriptional regulator with XRE-family HTH domain
MDALIGRRIRARRERLGMSQAKLGKAVRLTFQQIQKYESGANRVSARTLFSIARALSMPVGYFYDALEAPAPPNSVDDDPDPERLLALFAHIDNPKYRRQLLELALTLSEKQ